MTMPTQAEKRRMRANLTSRPQPIEETPPPIGVVWVKANPQAQNIVPRIRFGADAKALLPHLASIWAND